MITYLQLIFLSWCLFTIRQIKDHRIDFILYYIQIQFHIGSWLLLNSSGKYLLKIYDINIYFCTLILLLNIVRCSCLCVCQFHVTSVVFYLSILLSIRCEPSPERCRVTSMIIVQEPQNNRTLFTRRRTRRTRRRRSRTAKWLRLS